ncbi:MAG TPA: carbonic anhydrase [Acidimicrobiales bacterium]|jgi:carbonic anhydrase|nr:carbonic anhydrase [Acidimicrobiales bacterium]
MFDDLIDANEKYAATFTEHDLTGKAARHLAVVTCIDSRIDPLGIFGLVPGDAKIIRSAGARVTDDVLRNLVLSVNLLDVDRVVLMPHTDCAMGRTNAAIVQAVSEASGRDASAWDFRPIEDPDETLRADLARIRSCDLISDRTELVGWRYDVHTGLVAQVVDHVDG